MTTLLWNFYRKQIKSYIAGCVWTFSSPHTPFSLTTLLSPFIFCTEWSNCFWCDIILSQCYLPGCQPGLDRHPHDALSAKSLGKCFPDWCCASLTVVTHRRDSHSEPPVMDWSQTWVFAFEASAVSWSEGNDGTIAKIIYNIYLLIYFRKAIIEQH